MRILVTGATGFLGTSLCKALEAEGNEVVGLGSAICDLTQADSLNKFNGDTYDQLYHLAAWTQAGDFCLHHPGEQWIINQKINTNVLSWWQAQQPQAKLIIMGTSCAYAVDRALTEENYLEGLPIESLFAYAMTKRMLYVGARSLATQFGLKYVCLVPSTLYGTEYHEDGRQMHFIFDLIRKIIRGKLYGEPVVLWGDGHQVRELVVVDDFTRIAIDLAASQDNELINIGAGQGYSIREFAGLICAQVGYPAEEIQYDISRYLGAKSKVLVVDKLKHCLPAARLTSLEEGLARTIDWFWQRREVSLKPDPNIASTVVDPSPKDPAHLAAAAPRNM